MIHILYCYTYRLMLFLGDETLGKLLPDNNPNGKVYVGSFIT